MIQRYFKLTYLTCLLVITCGFSVGCSSINNSTVPTDTDNGWVATANSTVVGDLSLKMTQATTGDGLSAIIKANGYSLVTEQSEISNNVIVLKDVNFFEAIHTIALKNGFLAVIDHSSKNVYLKKRGVLIIKGPVSLLSKIPGRPKNSIDLNSYSIEGNALDISIHLMKLRNSLGADSSKIEYYITNGAK